MNICHIIESSGTGTLQMTINIANSQAKKKNNQVSELFVNAGIFYTQDEKDRSKKIYEDILESNNRFYSTLALNNIIEKT